MPELGAPFWRQLGFKSCKDNLFFAQIDSVPGYAYWYVTPLRGVLEGVYQGTLIGTPNADSYCTSETPILPSEPGR